MSQELCPLPTDLADERLNRVLTQYRESFKLLYLLKTYLTGAASRALEICDLPSKFDLDTATGDQLTIVGKWLGWPRCHCVCDTQPVFGFDCPGVIDMQPVAGFCDGNSLWFGCGESGSGDLCIVDDEIYRKFLQVRVFQHLGAFSLGTLKQCITIFWGETARVLDAGRGRVVVTPGRALDNTEIALLQLYPRILPVALGVEVRFHFSELNIFGFGEGWQGLCDTSIFGFCTDEWAGMCSDEAEVHALVTEEGEEIVTENEEEILAQILTHSSQWMCEIDTKPYSC